MKCEYCGFESDNEDQFEYPWLCRKCEPKVFRDFINSPFFKVWVAAIKHAEEEAMK